MDKSIYDLIYANAGNPVILCIAIGLYLFSWKEGQKNRRKYQRWDRIRKQQKRRR